MTHKEYEQKRKELFDMYKAKKIRSEETFKRLMVLEKEYKKGRK